MLNYLLARRPGACGALALFLGQAFAAQAQTPADEAAAETLAVAPVPQLNATVPPEEAASPSPLTANLTLTSQYVSRGFRQTWGKPAVQGGVDYADPSGWSVGTWMSSISDKFIEDGSVEWDLYAGYTGTVGDFIYAAQIYYYLYPGAKLQYAQTKYDYGEAVASLTYKWLNLKYWLTYTPDYFGYNDKSLLTTASTGDQHSRGSGYLDVNTNFDLGDGYGLQFHYGHQNVRNFSFANWSDAKAAVTKTLDGGWVATAAVTRGWDKDNYFKHYTTGAVDSSGHTDTSNPLVTTFLVSITKTF